MVTSIIQKSQFVALANNSEKLSAVISLFVAIIVLTASFFQWWDITWDGKMKTKSWLKILFSVSILALIIALILILI